jgi:MFS family permease
MIAADLLRALAALGYLTIGARGPIWVIYACSMAMSSFSMFFDAAKNAAMPNLVTPRELLTANVLMFSTRFLQFTLGAALGGLTAAHFGYEAAFIVNSLSFIGSAVYIALIPAAVMHSAESSPQASAESGAETERELDPLSVDAPGGVPIAGSEHPIAQTPGRFFTDLREGLAYVWATPFVRGLILVNIGWATGGGMINLLYDQIGGHIFARGAGDRGDWAVATLYTAAGAGLFIGMLLARRAGAWVADERRAGYFIGWSLVVHGISFAVSGLMPSLGLMSLWIGVSRFIIGMEFGVQETLMMRMLPDDYRGRVFTTDRSLEMTMMMISMIAGGWLLTWFSPRAMMVLSGLLSATPGLVWLVAIGFTRFSVPTRAVRESYGQ